MSTSTTQISRPATPKTPIITGVICGVCITLAWSISLGNWLLKKYRRRKLRKQRRSRSVAAGMTTPYDQSTTVSRGRYGGSVANRPALFISQPVPELTKEAPSPEDSKSPESIPPITSTTGDRGAREATSWIPESEWGKSHPHHPHHHTSARANFNNSSHPAKQLDNNNNDDDEASTLAGLSDYVRGAPYAQDQDEGHFHLSTLVLPPSPGRGQHDPNGDYFSSSRIPE